MQYDVVCTDGCGTLERSWPESEANSLKSGHETMTGHEVELRQSDGDDS